VTPAQLLASEKVDAGSWKGLYVRRRCRVFSKLEDPRKAAQTKGMQPEAAAALILTHPLIIKNDIASA
jgi:hypothetical protein